MTDNPFRPTYRELTEEEATLSNAIKNRAQDLLTLYLRLNSGRYRALAITSLEESVMWAIKELTT